MSSKQQGGYNKSNPKKTLKPGLECYAITETSQQTLTFGTYEQHQDFLQPTMLLDIQNHGLQLWPIIMDCRGSSLFQQA